MSAPKDMTIHQLFTKKRNSGSKKNKMNHQRL